MYGVDYPSTSGKVGTVLFGIMFLNTELNKPRNVVHPFFATNKTKHILFRHISYSSSDTIYSASIKTNHKKTHFEGLPFLY